MRAGWWLWLVLCIACGDDSEARDAGAEDAAEAGPADAGEDAIDSAYDAGDNCRPPGDCDPFDPAACRAGEVCVRRSTGRTECRSGPGDADLDELCSRGSDCRPGLLCVNTGGEQRCQRSCPLGSVGFCGGEERCSGSIGDACLGFCRLRSPTCDVYAQDCEAADDACTFAMDPETDERYTGCRPAGPRTIGTACGEDEGFCEAGLVCIREDPGGVCREVCNAELPTDTCRAGEVCSGLSAGWRVTFCEPE